MEIRRLTPDDAPAYRALMLRVYVDDPETFAATLGEREPLPLAWWAARLAPGADAPERVLGAFVGGRLVGAAGLRRQPRERTRHKATLFGMAVLRENRGRGVARALVGAVIEAARATPGVRVVQLDVAASNAPAIRLYERAGFESFGVEPFALRTGDGFTGLVHMWRPVGIVDPAEGLSPERDGLLSPSGL